MAVQSLAWFLLRKRFIMKRIMFLLK